MNIICCFIKLIKDKYLKINKKKVNFISRLVNNSNQLIIKITIEIYFN